MFEAIKQFCINHSQHSGVENILLILAIIAGSILVIETIIYLFRLTLNIKQIEKNIKKSKRSSDKNILNMLKKKKNKSF